jgi:LPS sulfotransferase NodH
MAENRCSLNNLSKRVAYLVQGRPETLHMVTIPAGSEGPRQECAMGLRNQLAVTGKRFYCICFTCRSGSTLLANDLAQLGLGEPTEYFQLADPGHPSVADYIVELVDRTEGEFFGFKVAWNQASLLTHELLRQGDASVTSDLRTVFPDLRFINIVRSDKVAQAVSYWRAAVTDQWHQVVDREVVLACPEYDFAAISEALLAVVTEDWLWQSHFASSGIPCHRIVYEDYLLNRSSALVSISDFLGSPRPRTTALSDRTMVMRDEWSKEIVSQVWADLDASARRGVSFAQRTLAGIAVGATA